MKLSDLNFDAAAAALSMAVDITNDSRQRDRRPAGTEGPIHGNPDSKHIEPADAFYGGAAAPNTGHSIARD